MSVPQLILAGTLLIFIVAVVVFVAAAIRSRRDRSRFEYVPASVPRAHRGAGAHADMSLEGLDVGIAEDSMSASLLTPLRTGEWMPPEEPAPLEGLDEVSLAGRVAEYTPAPDVPEPAFSVEEYPPWQVGDGASAPTSESRPPAPDVPEPAPQPMPVAATEPELPPKPEPAAAPPAPGPAPLPEPVAVPALLAVEDVEEPDEFSAEIAALLPMPISLEEPLAPKPAVEPMQTPVPEPVATPTPQPEPTPPPAPVTVPAPAPDVATETPSVVVPVVMPAEVSTPAAPALPAPAVVDALADDEVWDATLAEQTRPAPRASAPRAPAAVRPAARVAEPPPPPAPVVAPISSSAPAPRVRPQARVHLAEAEQAGAAIESGVRHVASAVSGGASGAPDRAAVDPQLVMAAPIEMWFGDSRIGVKAGTATYERFRKYADALLADLPLSKATPR